MLGSAQESMVKEGYYFGLPPLVLGGVSFLLHWYVAAVVLVLLAAFVFSFFRDPERVIPTDLGAVVARGERIGLVRFGSRVDVWVPQQAQILVKLGESVRGGSSVLARWPAQPVAGKLSTAETESNLTAAGKQS